jgi:hypothetical protein
MVAKLLETLCSEIMAILVSKGLLVTLSVANSRMGVFSLDTLIQFQDMSVFALC